jgi:hypothetical protein
MTNPHKKQQSSRKKSVEISAKTKQIAPIYSLNMNNKLIQISSISHGKQFINRWSFLKYINDKPKVGNEHTFPVLLTTEGIVIAINNLVWFCRYDIYSI